MTLRHLALAVALAVSPAAYAAQCADALKMADAAIKAPKPSVDEEDLLEAVVIRDEAAELLAAGQEADCLYKAEQALDLLDAPQTR